jgi:excisionase family DNA binding protein
MTLLSTRDVAKQLKVSTKTVGRYVDKGLPYFDLPGGWRFDPDEVYEWIEQYHRHARNGNGDKSSGSDG